MNPLTATVVITTKNRKDELRKAVTSALAQTAKPDVLVIDDGSTDGTSEMIRAEFPTVRLDRVEKSLGLVTQRNRGAQMATTDVIFSIDDDAEFVSPNTVQQTLADFDHPRIGAVAIPFVNVRQDNKVQQRSPEANRIFVSDWYIGTAHALRRDVFLRVGGYRDYIVHQGEEIDYCIRMLDAGYVVRLGRADPIHHYESPRRSFRRMSLYGSRNAVVEVWHNVPAVYVPVRWVRAVGGGILAGIRNGRIVHIVQGLAWGLGCVFVRWKYRRPVSMKTYKLYRRLIRGGPQPLDDIESLLPELSK